MQEKDFYQQILTGKAWAYKEMLRDLWHHENVVSYCTHGITNAVAEGINSNIQSVKRRVGGYRNKENYKTAIFFHCGGLDLNPHSTVMDLLKPLCQRAFLIELNCLGCPQLYLIFSG